MLAKLMVTEPGKDFGFFACPCKCRVRYLGFIRTLFSQGWCMNYSFSLSFPFSKVWCQSSVSIMVPVHSTASSFKKLVVVLVFCHWHSTVTEAFSKEHFPFRISEFLYGMLVRPERTLDMGVILTKDQVQFSVDLSQYSWSIPALMRAYYNMIHSFMFRFVCTVTSSDSPQNISL